MKEEVTIVEAKQPVIQKEEITKPESILQEGNHEGGCDNCPSQTPAIWLSIVHHHWLWLNC